MGPEKSDWAGLEPAGYDATPPGATVPELDLHPPHRRATPWPAFVAADGNLGGTPS